jgi:excisionase family DNA binding protein
MLSVFLDAEGERPVVVVLEQYLSVGQAAMRLGVSQVTVRKLIEAGRLESVRDPLGHRWILRTSLERLIAERAARSR